MSKKLLIIPLLLITTLLLGQIASAGCETNAQGECKNK